MKDSEHLAWVRGADNEEVEEFVTKWVTETIESCPFEHDFGPEWSICVLRYENDANIRHIVSAEAFLKWAEGRDDVVPIDVHHFVMGRGTALAIHSIRDGKPTNAIREFLGFDDFDETRYEQLVREASIRNTAEAAKIFFGIDAEDPERLFDSLSAWDRRNQDERGAYPTKEGLERTMIELGIL